MSIAVGGLISGLDTETIISQMMDLERAPVIVLQQEEAYYQSQISSLGSLKGSLSALQTSLAPLQEAGNFVSLVASSSNTDVLTVSSSGTAAIGQYQIEVTDLAQAQQVRSSAFAGSGQIVGTGTLTIQVGSGTAFDITIDSSNDTLEEIVSSINAAGTDVNAAVVNDGNGNYYLTLASKETGSANSISLTMIDGDANNDDALGLSSLYTTPASHSLTETQAAQNAKLTVNGIAVERAGNTIDDLIDGLTLDVEMAAPGNPFTVDVSEDLTTVTSKVQAFVDQYNALIDNLTKLQEFNAETGQSGALQGDRTTRQIQSRLQAFLYTQIDGVSSDVNGLSRLGIEQDRHGQLSLDSDVLTSALENNRQDVTNFFSQAVTDKNGFAVQLDDILEGYVSSTGLLDAREEGLNSSIKDNEDKIEKINYRLLKKEDLLRMQFESLEALLATFDTTSGVLNGQLDSLANLNSQIYKK